MKRAIVIAALMMALAARAQDAAPWWNALAADGAAEWTPLSLAPSVWWDASDASTITITDGGVSSWVDKSGNGYSASQTFSGSRPVVNSAAQNGKNVLFLDGQNDFMTHGFSVTNGPFTSFTVAKTLTVESNFKTMIYAGQAMCCLQTGGGSGQWGLYEGVILYSGFVPTDMTIMTVVTRNLNDIDLVTNGGKVTVSGGAWWNTGYKFIGSSDGGEYCHAQLCEILIFYRAITDTERKRVEAYLGSKWGITLAP